MHPHDLPLAILRACGVPTDQVRSITFRAAVGEPAELDVTYLAVNQAPEAITAVSEAQVKFRQVTDNA